jgi:phosphonate transport system ATP-binding protein
VSPVAVQLDGVRVMAGERALLSIDHLRIAVGERVAIVGPNGAGKSTLLKVMGQMVSPTQGGVEVLGRSLAPQKLPAEASRALRRETGLLLQGLHLVPRLSARDNVMVGALGRLRGWDSARSLLRWFPPSCMAEADAALAALGLADRADVRADQLSGGERQKVALARLQLQRPRLLLADEPTSALDPAATVQICTALTAAARDPDQTLISVVHDLELLPRLATRVIGMADGRVLWDHACERLTRSLLQQLYEAAPAPSLANPSAVAAPHANDRHLSWGRTGHAH